MILLDTSILIDHIRRKNALRKTLLDRISSIEGYFNLGISVVTIQELYQGRSTRESALEDEILDLLSYIKIFPYDEGTAQAAGELVRDWRNNMEFADTAIASTAINEGCSLFTLNLKDFKDIPELNLYYLPMWN